MSNFHFAYMCVLGTEYMSIYVHTYTCLNTCIHLRYYIGFVCYNFIILLFVFSRVLFIMYIWLHVTVSATRPPSFSHACLFICLSLGLSFLLCLFVHIDSSISPAVYICLFVCRTLLLTCFLLLISSLVCLSFTCPHVTSALPFFLLSNVISQTR